MRVDEGEYLVKWDFAKMPVSSVPETSFRKVPRAFA